MLNLDHVFKSICGTLCSTGCQGKRFERRQAASGKARGDLNESKLASPCPGEPKLDVRPNAQSRVPSPSSSVFHVCHWAQEETREEKAPARLMAATAVLRKHWFWSRAATCLVLYRMLGLVANCALVGIVLWWIDPFLFLLLFLLLWYLPAALRGGLLERPADLDVWVTPIMYPILLFVVDDFSWVGIHPDQRNARRLHVVYVIRVLLMLGFILACNDGNFCRVVINEEAFSDENSPLKQIYDNFAIVFRGSSVELLRRDVEKGDPVSFLTVFWSVTAEVIVCLSAVWVTITGFLAAATLSGALIVQDTAALHQMDRIQRLSVAIEDVIQVVDPPRGCENCAILRACEQCQAKLDECKRMLQNMPLKDEACRAIVLASPFARPIANPVLVAVLYCFNSMIAFLNVYTYGSSWTFQGLACSLILLGHVFLTARFTWSLGLADPRELVREVRLSLDQGIFTWKLLALLKSDKGVLALPALVLSLGAMPRTIYKQELPAWQQAIMAVVAVAFVAGNLVCIGKFVFEQFDLGVECEDKRLVTPKVSSSSTKARDFEGICD